VLKAIIKVHNLSKRYRLGLKEKQANTLVGQIKNTLNALIDYYKRFINRKKY
jgi:lipopolysaccharide transport system ATP-binding protein